MDIGLCGDPAETAPFKMSRQEHHQVAAEKGNAPTDTSSRAAASALDLESTADSGVHPANSFGPSALVTSMGRGGKQC